MQPPIADKGCRRVLLSWNHPQAQHLQSPRAIQASRFGNHGAQACLRKASQTHQHCLRASQDVQAEPASAKALHTRPPELLRISQACTLALFGMLSLAAFSNSALAASAASSGGFTLGGAFKGMLSFILHLDVHLSQIIAAHGSTTYAILFAIVFCETGLVLTPFLPGDSLLFASGAFAALGSLDLVALMAVFISSAILGDAVNYSIGKWLGGASLRGNWLAVPAMSGAKATTSRLIKKEYVEKTEAFYAKHGGKTVVLARFIPIVRTFAPFVAGVGTMPYGSFAAYNVGGAVLWSVLFVGAGYLLGNLPAVKHNFTLVVFAIVGISVLPLLFEGVAEIRKQRLQRAASEGKNVGSKIAKELDSESGMAGSA